MKKTFAQNWNDYLIYLNGTGKMDRILICNILLWDRHSKFEFESNNLCIHAQFSDMSTRHTEVNKDTCIQSARIQKEVWWEVLNDAMCPQNLFFCRFNAGQQSNENNLIIQKTSCKQAWWDTIRMLRTLTRTNTWKWDESTTERRLMPTFMELNMPRCPETVASPSWRKLLPGSCEDSQKILSLSL